MNPQDLGVALQDDLASIQYVGLAGITKPSIEAVQDLLQSNREWGAVTIITNIVQPAGGKHKRERPHGQHALFFEQEFGPRIVVKSGFSSGYRGEGPSGFSHALQLLDAHGIDVHEVEVPAALMLRLDHGVLTENDLETVMDGRRETGVRYEYVDEDDRQASDAGLLWRRFPFVMPYAILDPRLIPLARTFWQKPMDNLRAAFILVEDELRVRTGFRDHGEELFKKAFLPPTAKLHWPGLDKNETAARALLFQSVFRSHRNPRHHRNLNDDIQTQQREFLAINHLLCLEGEANPGPPSFA